MKEENMKKILDEATTKIIITNKGALVEGEPNQIFRYISKFINKLCEIGLISKEELEEALEIEPKEQEEKEEKGEKEKEDFQFEEIIKKLFVNCNEIENLIKELVGDDDSE